MTKEEVLAVIQKIKDTWAAFSQSMAEAAQALEDMFRCLGKSDELWPKRNGMPPKKYGMTVQERRFLLSLYPACTSKSALPAADILMGSG